MVAMAHGEANQHQARVTGLDLGTDQQGHLLMVTGADDRRIIVWRLET